MIYLDHNATTPLLPEVSRLLVERLSDPESANPASVHRPGQRARARLESARSTVARAFGVEPKEICFVGSGSEANALALTGAFHARADLRRNKVVTSSIEHPSVLFTLERLEKTGARVVRVDPEPNGAISAEAFLAALDDETALATLMWANNETGVLQPVREVALAARARGIPFHTDAVQATGKVPTSVREVDADLIACAAHKLGGPPGVGALVVRRDVVLEPLCPGHQEGGRRGGTPALAPIEAFALALELSTERREAEFTRLSALRDGFEREVCARVPETFVNGGVSRVPNTSSLRFAGVDGEALLIALDLEDIAVSLGAACASGTVQPSHVLRAMGLSVAEAKSSLRFSFGATTTEDDVGRVVEALVRLVPRARGA